MGHKINLRGHEMIDGTGKKKEQISATHINIQFVKSAQIFA